ncbi:putative membrane protein [Mycobacteroides abscessus 1948]|uniref:Putative membrane protein n=1 Tax=Mycobacteroides abscessus 1948 TaxID=1299323 RepID=A0A829QP25_9MYCO|nr:putative membrane protein [Mycobacteroides abscessus 1948]
MAPLIALVVGTLSARLAGILGLAPADSWPAAVAVGLAAMFTLTGIAHFVPKMRDAMIAIVPPRIPAPGFLVALTGALELLGARPAC